MQNGNLKSISSSNKKSIGIYLIYLIKERHKEESCTTNGKVILNKKS